MGDTKSAWIQLQNVLFVTKGRCRSADLAVAGVVTGQGPRIRDSNPSHEPATQAQSCEPASQAQSREPSCTCSSFLDLFL